MIKVQHGNLLKSDAEAYVNTVNTMGIMGKGIALQFKRAYPKNYTDYAAASKEGRVQVGKMFVSEQPLMRPHYIINFPTKQHWRENSRLEYVREGLIDLVRIVQEYQIKSIAVPPLGCGYGGLDWEDVRPMIYEAFETMPEVEVLLFPPDSAPAPLAMPNAKKTVRMTAGRAVMIKLFDLYLEPDYFLGRIESMKLAYFLQAAGENLKLNFVAHQFGPYSDKVQHVLEDMEGTFIEGVGDGSSRTEIQLKDGAVEEADTFLAGNGDALQRLEMVSELIQGFETSYTMELLASVHWVAVQQGASTWEEALEKVGAWTPRKKRMMQPHHVMVAWERLEELGWLGLKA